MNQSLCPEIGECCCPGKCCEILLMVYAGSTTSCLSAEILRFPLFFLGWDSFPRGLVGYVVETACYINIKAYLSWGLFNELLFSHLRELLFSEPRFTWVAFCEDSPPVSCWDVQRHLVQVRGADGSLPSLHALLCWSRVCPTGLSALV